MLRLLAWTMPAVLHASDAFAWGLYTHMYFAQLLIWTLPFADRGLRRALRRFPGLCFAGTCLPDVALFSRMTGVSALAGTHEWPAAARMLRAAASDEERAIAIGYAGHLLTDIVAHNYFVPTHEVLWFDGRMLTHAACEWAMDAHLAPRLFVRPGDLIERHAAALARYAGGRLGCDAASVSRGLSCLRRGERALRASRLPQLIYRGAKRLDRGIASRFDDYVHETAARLAQIDRLARGEVPAWAAEPPRLATKPSRGEPARAPAMRHASLLPADFFRNTFAHGRKP